MMRMSTPSARSRHAPSCLLEKHEQLVSWFVARLFRVERTGARERLFLQTEVRMQVHLRGFHGFMSKPQRDHRPVDAVT